MSVKDEPAPGPTEEGPARLVDVALAAGVHVSTASRVLNSAPDGRVSPATRDRVLAAADRLGYRPNAMARGLKLATTGALGLLVPSLRNPVFSTFIRGAFHRASEHGFVVLLAADEDGDFRGVYERLVEEGRIDGLLISSARLGDPLLARLAKRQIPSVFVNRRHAESGRNVTMGDEEAGRMAARFLLDLGHRRLGLLAGPEDLDTAQRRAAGFVSVVRTAGLTPVVARAAYDEDDAYREMSRLLEAEPELDAVFVSNFNQAIGSLSAVNAAGISVPQQLSIVACDDDPILEYLHVPLTAIRMPLWQLGIAAVDALVGQIDGARPHDVSVEDPPVLVERESTAPAR
ncbi:LacI family transcriptional regulator [Blastococcus sp. CT_GayMR20]|uniref:LacI family DNA-binding transcriptional regulator n=1 Tax=Blastococcus sp. CT_GayMR20 TaxID=2559609 RepID=UPI0010738475|nr:LacI family DNA-binding transcriptional regulator [Blastococcus sp. CT_GayMR20]TFV81169.1 LacI family transcriptional regulator [Blastococcus sp. CT_GayMR20]